MAILLEFLNWFGSLFSFQQYLIWTRIECTAWTLADLLIVFILLRIADLARSAAGVHPHRVSYIFFTLTVPFAIAIPIGFADVSIFVLELAVTIPHFLIILYVLLFDSRLFLKMVQNLPTISQSLNR